MIGAQAAQSHHRPSQRPSPDLTRCSPRDVSPTYRLLDVVFQMPPPRYGFPAAPSIFWIHPPGVYRRMVLPNCLLADVSPEASSQNHPQNAFSHMILPRCFDILPGAWFRVPPPRQLFPYVWSHLPQQGYADASRRSSQPTAAKEPSQSRKIAESGYAKNLNNNISP